MSQINLGIVRRPVLGTIVILLIPLIAARFSSEVVWSLSDFIIMGIMLFVTGLALEFIRLSNNRYRLPAIVAVILAFLWLWAELAVGIFTTWGS